MANSDISSKFIDRIDESKRASIRKMITGTAFMVPAIASFSLNGLAINKAHAQTYASNATVVSDLRLKQDICPVETLPNGLQLYSFRYWNDDRTFIGVMAQDLLKDKRFRHAVSQGKSGYYSVDLAALGLDVVGSREEFFEAGQRALDGAEPVVN
jgi:hypothetical protein